MKLTTPRILSAIALAALTLWIGGLITLGAVVAPIIFAAVPHATAADAMTVVFGRFDTIAMTCAGIVLGTEALRGGRETLGRPEIARVAVTVVMVALAVADGAWVTPEITALHAAGAVRGVAEAGMKLDSLHTYAEAFGKLQGVLAIALIALHAVTLGQEGAPPAPTPKPAKTPAKSTRKDDPEEEDEEEEASA